MCSTPEERANETAQQSGLSDPNGPREMIEMHTVPVSTSVPRMLQELWLLPRNVAIAIMHAYRRVISPLYGEVCKYYPSCSRYAMEAFARQGLLVGFTLTAWRLLRCNPFSSGGIDDAPERRHPRFVVNPRGFVRPIERKV